MQDEIIKHSKKAIHTMKNKEHSVAHKIKEICIEIFIIVFAVSFSIWLHSWSEHRHQQAEVKEFLSDLKDDLKNDSMILETGKQQYMKTVESFTYLINIKENTFDSLIQGKDSVAFKNDIRAKINSMPSFWRKSNCGNYEGFKSSGKIGFIENKKLKKLILRYYEQQNTVTALQDDYLRQETEKLGTLIADMAGKKAREIVFNQKINIHLRIMMLMSNSCIQNYDETIAAANDIIAEIDKDVQ